MSPQHLAVALQRPAVPTCPPAVPARGNAGKLRYSICTGPDGQLKKLHVLDGTADLAPAIAGARWFGGSLDKAGLKNGKPVGVCGAEVEYTRRVPPPPQL